MQEGTRPPADLIDEREHEVRLVLLAPLLRGQRVEARDRVGLAERMERNTGGHNTDPSAGVPGTAGSVRDAATTKRSRALKDPAAVR